MKSLEQKLNPELKVETVKTPEGGEVSFCAERGGIITSLKIGGEEVLYMDQETFNNKDVSVKGGIPILFPNAGPIPDEIKTPELSDLKQHGFARDMKWFSKKEINGFSEVLISNNDTKKVFPYDFKLSLESKFETDGSFVIKQIVENLSENTDLPISSGLHPYFKVPNLEKQNIKFDFPGGDFVKENIEKWANGKAISIDNPNVPLRIETPNLGTLVLTISEEYQKVWFWSMPGKDFFCAEPVMRDKGGIINDPTKVKMGENFSASFNINLEKL